VARADGPLGPFEDTGTNLTPGESFAIDAHPFQDDDGARYLFFARDVLDHPRPGTHLAVAQMPEPTRLGPTVPALQPNADWQLYQRSRTMYGREFDWHTLEGPAVVHRLGAYWMTFSGGAWTGADYAVSWARAAHPLGPWEHAPAGSPRLLATDDVLTGPGHNSLTTTPTGADAIAYHAWDAGRTRRQFRIDALRWTSAGPRIAQPG
jgi:GH43 family beta-xylosidase